MTKRLCLWLACAMVAIGGFASPAAAQQEDDVRDARYEGYGTGRNTRVINLEPESTALVYFFASFLGVLCFAPLFMNARRTHLD